MIKDRTFEENSEFFSTVFEIGRRHKILNPECMRTDYGKLIHMLMDSQNPDIQRLLEFKLVKKVSWCYPNHFFRFFFSHRYSLLRSPPSMTFSSLLIVLDCSKTPTLSQRLLPLSTRYRKVIFGEDHKMNCFYISRGDPGLRSSRQ